MRRKPYGLPELTDTDRREARRIVLDARTHHGSTERAAKALGIPKGTLSTIASGAAQAGQGIYLKLKEYERTRG
jgi:hypothetical protein